MDEGGLALTCDGGKVGGGQMVEQVCESQVSLGLLHVGICCAVDYDVDVFRCAYDAHRVDVGYVEVHRLGVRHLGDVGEDEAVCAPG